MKSPARAYSLVAFLLLASCDAECNEEGCVNEVEQDELSTLQMAKRLGENQGSTNDTAKEDSSPHGPSGDANDFAVELTCEEADTEDACLGDSKCLWLGGAGCHMNISMAVAAMGSHMPSLTQINSSRYHCPPATLPFYVSVGAGSIEESPACCKVKPQNYNTRWWGYDPLFNPWGSAPSKVSTYGLTGLDWHGTYATHGTSLYDCGVVGSTNPYSWWVTSYASPCMLQTVDTTYNWCEVWIQLYWWHPTCVAQKGKFALWIEKSCCGVNPYDSECFPDPYATGNVKEFKEIEF